MTSCRRARAGRADGNRKGPSGWSSGMRGGVELLGELLRSGRAVEMPSDLLNGRSSEVGGIKNGSER